MQCFNVKPLSLHLSALLVLAICHPLGADVLKPATEAIAAQPVLTFCYEDKQLLPYYTENSRDIPDRPGATIEHLKIAAAQVGITLKLTRMPWLRCLQQLEDNSVDAVVAAYVEDREHYTKYPKRSDGSADPSRAINQLGLCLAHRFDNPIDQKIASEQQLTVSRPLGYRPIPFPVNTVLVGAQSPDNALDLVINGRVDATTVLCQLNGVDARERHLNLLPLQLLYPPMHQSFGYLMLSNAFYRQHRQLSEQLWQALPQTLNKLRYLEYLSYPD
ncbi:amino acid ABC transporter [Rheinheimera aquimaris]|jgi:hypothetical protein|uniref:amino acid ABC transporter n=1 Tax=Rheinheimera aquimaris TaxID=412437 RepID=UPI000E80CA14|nr:amino acid ABC transporter [Rheinheimera aquimaris]HBN89222.1 amino acid ABC transporter [Rheinheimera sp.]|tara:strand:- start:11876 stop:12697 length:822 start_codon:yes stop_codon:yes gene_type:complete